MNWEDWVDDVWEELGTTGQNLFVSSYYVFLMFIVWVS